MRVLKSKYLRVFFILLFVLSFSISSAFGATMTYTLPYAEPPTSDNQGYISVYVENYGVYTYYWSVKPYVNDNNSGSGTVALNISQSGSIAFTFTALGSSSVYYTLTELGANDITLLTSSATSSNSTYTKNFSGRIMYVIYNGNISNVRMTDTIGRLDISWGYYSGFYNKLNSIFDLLGDINGNIVLTYDLVNDIYDFFKQWNDATLDESTDPLPNQGLNNFESSQGSLRNDSDVSSSLDNVFTSVDFGSFSNGFSAIWDLVDGVLYSHPIFFTLVILVLSLGLLNLIFNRR